MPTYINYGDWPIKQKISFIVLLTSGILFFVMVLFVTIEKSYSYRARLEKDSAVLAKIIGTNSTAALSFNDSATGYEILSALKAEKDIIEAALYQENGLVFTYYTNPDYFEGKSVNLLPTVLDPNSVVTTISLGAPWFDTMQPITLDSHPIGHIVLRTDLSPLKNQLQLFLLIITLFSIVLLTAAMAICSRLNRVILEPVTELADTMRNVTRTQNYNVRVTKKHDDEIGVLIEGFNTMLSRISQRDAELAGYRNHLEEQVLTRTRELKSANEQLLHEVEERQEVQKRLAHAQKMEAIGTLAGGVAHDLNNILSGVVSYPDLLLQQLPEDSSLRRPLETIRTSGKKAAAIVQDLLTLARRGLKVEELIELRGLVAAYLDSPECLEVLRSNPGVTIDFDRKGIPFHITGSPIHISKTIMNLVSNAAEAIPATGTIEISLDDVYLDVRPVDFNQWREGTYIRLTVADTGIGIAEQYLERIFEPFYSRKVMGKSGTGLGIATTFQLFFPASTKSPVTNSHNLLAEVQYRGTGESILVVDDSEQQRQIATDILDHLGYTAVSCASGEEAIHYLRDNQADLVILDMLMEPGISGLETYQQILRFRPDQAALIASGYSRREPIDEALALGIADYIVKPYTVARIGEAVHKVLHRKTR